MLSKKEWVKAKVVKWEGIKNCDTKTIEGGYLFVRDTDGQIMGLCTRNVSSRSEAIDYHYGCYVQEQHKLDLSFTTPDLTPVSEDEIRGGL